VQQALVLGTPYEPRTRERPRQRAIEEIYCPLFYRAFPTGVSEQQRRGTTRMFGRSEAFKELL